ncbi:hypothetical protein ACHQM5_022395 [Ranunculus cassubicifolius]
MDLWSQLPLDLLNQITNLLNLPDLIKLSCVCSPWRSISPSTQHRGHLPWLLLPSQNNSPNSGNIWPNSLYFYSILDKTYYELDLPEIKDRRICGSSNGWLITIHENADIYLLHPLSRKVIMLPSLNDVPGVYGIGYSNDDGLQYIVSDSVGRRRSNASFWNSSVARDEYIVKVIVCVNLNVVLGILGELGRLLVCRVQGNEKRWIVVEDDVDAMYMDVSFYKGEFYAVDSSGAVVVVDCDELRTRKVIDGHGYGYQSYLVESSGDLLKVIRFLSSFGEESDDSEAEDGEPRQLNKTIRFEVWKIDFEQGLWLEVKNLGDRALFLGINHSSSVCSSDFPGCKGNCIYFTDDCRIMHTGDYDKGICNLENGRIEAIYPDDDSKMILPRPVWYSPIQGQS